MVRIFRILIVVFSLMLNGSICLGSTEGPFFEDGENLFQEIGCRVGFNNESGSEMGTTLPNSFCYINSVVGGGANALESNHLKTQLAATLRVLKAECSRNMNLVLPEYLNLFQRACEFPVLFSEYNRQRNEIAHYDEDIVLFDKWNMTDLAVGNFTIGVFSEIENPLQIVAGLLLAEKQMSSGLVWVARLFRHLSPQGPSIEILHARLQAALFSYSKPKMMLKLFNHLDCQNISGKGAKRSCQVTKDILFLNLKTAMQGMPNNIDAYIDHKIELADSKTTQTAVAEREGVTESDKVISTRPEIARLKAVINSQRIISSLEANVEFRFQSWEQEDLQPLLTSLEAVTGKNEYPDDIAGFDDEKDLTDLARTYRAMGEIITFKSIETALQSYTLSEPELATREFDLWQENIFVSRVQSQQIDTFKKSVNRIDTFLGEQQNEKAEK